MPEDVEQALSGSRQWIKSDLKGDIVMVGHLVSDDPVDRWLSHSSNRELWWVSDAAPADPGLVQTWAREYHEVTGDLGRPQVFFTQLALRLLRPAAATLREAMPEAAGEIESAQIPNQTPETRPDELLRSQLLRSQTVLYDLDQAGPAGDRSTSLQAQILYQKRRVSELEDRIRLLPNIRPRVVDLVKKIAGDVLRGHGSAGDDELGAIARFIAVQAASLEVELLTKETPNQILVSALLGGTLTAADRVLTEFGQEVVDPKDVKQLAELAPTAASKVVL